MEMEALAEAVVVVIVLLLAYNHRPQVACQ